MKRATLAALAVLVLLSGAACRKEEGSRMECSWRDPKTGVCKAWVEREKRG